MQVLPAPYTSRALPRILQPSMVVHGRAEGPAWCGQRACGRSLGRWTGGGTAAPANRPAHGDARGLRGGLLPCGRLGGRLSWASWRRYRMRILHAQLSVIMVICQLVAWVITFICQAADHGLLPPQPM